METLTVCVRLYIPEARGIVPLLLTLFTVNNTDGNIIHNTDGNTNRWFPSVYSRGEENCSPSHIGDGNY